MFHLKRLSQFYCILSFLHVTVGKLNCLDWAMHQDGDSLVFELLCYLVWASSSPTFFFLLHSYPSCTFSGRMHRQMAYRLISERPSGADSRSKWPMQHLGNGNQIGRASQHAMGWSPWLAPVIPSPWNGLLLHGFKMGCRERHFNLP